MFGNMFAFKGSFQAEVRTRSHGRNPPPSRSPARPPRPQRERTRCCVSDDVVARSRAPPRVRPAESGDEGSNISCAFIWSQRVRFLTSSPIYPPNAPGHRRRERERRVGHSPLPQGRDVFRSHQRGTSVRTHGRHGETGFEITRAGCGATARRVRAPRSTPGLRASPRGSARRNTALTLKT